MHFGTTRDHKQHYAGNTDVIRQRLSRGEGAFAIELQVSWHRMHTSKLVATITGHSKVTEGSWGSSVVPLLGEPKVWRK